MPRKRAEERSVWGIVWQQGDNRNWDRYLIRRTKSGVFSSDSLIHVDEGRPTCMHCLSQNVVPAGPQWQDLKCLSCNIQYDIVEEYE